MRCKVLSDGKFKKPWITEQLRECIVRKHSLFRQFKRGAVPFHMYNTFKNAVTRILKRKKSEYFRNKFGVLSGDVRGTWRAINTLIGKKRANNSPKELLVDERTYSTPAEIADCFNAYFADIAAVLDGEIPACDIIPTSYMGERNSTSFFISPILDSDVRTVICALKNKSSSLNSIPIFIYKACVDLLCPVIAKLFNLSISSGTFPASLKSARVIPVFKCGEQKLPGNYRPISTLPIMSKIFEKIMCAKLNEFLKYNNLLTPGQFGFRKNCSTADAVLEFVDCVNNTLDSKMSMITVFLDFSKAFDTVRHEILIEKLNHMGVRGKALEWFTSYLSGRQQCVEVDGIRSRPVGIRTGVPQGSVLGPLLFLLYINDMNKCATKLKFIHFADDTTVFGYDRDIQALGDTFCTELSCIYNWLCSNRLSLNIDKTCYMVLTDQMQIVMPNLCINNRNIRLVQEAKFLGVTIDSRLTFKAHVNNISRKISRNIGVLNRISGLIPPAAKKSIYFSLVYSHVIYCITVWGKRSLGNSRHIGRLLCKATKIVSYPHPPDRGPASALLNFDSSYSYFTLIKLFSIMKSDHHLYFRNSIEELIPRHDYHTRFSNQGNFQPPFYSKAKCQKNFLYQSISLWNDLPARIKCCDSVTNFKMLLKRELVLSQSSI